ncbi:MAG: hypothetical protein MZV49_16850 [Rhodopseudomonas palustris]|nr:hypothetical protein [Rhodopseudomonas palustris]
MPASTCTRAITPGRGAAQARRERAPPPRRCFGLPEERAGASAPIIEALRLRGPARRAELGLAA